MLNLKRWAVMAGWVVLLVSITKAADYYVDPATGSMGNNGSSGNPWSTLAEVVSAKTFSGGDTIFLRSGFHGAPSISGSHSSDVVIMAEEGHNPQIKNIRFRTSRHWVLDGVTISPENDPPYAPVSNLAYLDGGATYITVKNCSLYSVKDVSGWSSSDWNNLPCNGFRIDAGHNTISNNLVMNFDFGLSTGYNADYCLVEYNTLRDFSGDGLRGLGDYGVFQYNVVKNCYDVNANHDDAFQSWSYDGGVGRGVVKGIVLRGNFILNWEDYNQPFRGSLQAIGLFDGFFEDWRVENNLVISDHYHGITFLGARQCTVINNTVFSIPQASVGPLWIQIGNHKNGSPSTGNLVRNNLGEQLKPMPPGNTEDHNILGTWGKLYVMDYRGMDYHLKPGMPPMYGLAAIDSGSAEAAPSIDIDGNSRPFGSGFDIGAFEYRPGQTIRNVGYQVPVRSLGAVRVVINRHIRFLVETGRAGQVAIRVFNVTGKARGSLPARTLPAGTHTFTMEKQSLTSGIYIYTIALDGRTSKQGQFVVW